MGNKSFLSGYFINMDVGELAAKLESDYGIAANEKLINALEDIARRQECEPNDEE